MERNPRKAVCRQTLNAFVETYVNRPRALFLDTAQCQSSRSLPVPPQRQTVVEMDRRTYDKMRKVNPRVRHVHSKLGDYIEQRVKINENVLFYDYFCSYRGNKTEGIYPMKDLYDTLEKASCRTLIVAFTCSLRTGVAGYVTGPGKQKEPGMQTVRELIEDGTFIHLQYLVLDSTFVSYKGANGCPMGFFCYAIRKWEAINPENARFNIVDGRWEGWPETEKLLTM